MRDFLPGADKSDSKAREKGPAAEKRRFGNFFAQVPPDFQSRVSSIAQENHRYFKEKFPTVEEFQDAVAESWIEKRKGFEEETRHQGFVPIESGTKASELNECTLAYLTESGSFVVLGPGSFEGKIVGAPGAAFSYVKIPFRKDPEAPKDMAQESGVFVGKTPRLGDRIYVRGLIKRYEEDPGMLSTSLLINQMMRPTSRAEAVPILERAKAGITKRFEEVNEQTGLALVRPKA
ncbi:MAG: hypothetical protein AAB802_02485 [Patescibacteria group bacterium]